MSTEQTPEREAPCSVEYHADFQGPCALPDGHEPPCIRHDHGRHRDGECPACEFIEARQAPPSPLEEGEREAGDGLSVGLHVHHRRRREAAREIIGLTPDHVELAGLSGNQRNSRVRRDGFASVYQVVSDRPSSEEGGALADRGVTPGDPDGDLTFPEFVGARMAQIRDALANGEANVAGVFAQDVQRRIDRLASSSPPREGRERERYTRWTGRTVRVRADFDALRAGETGVVTKVDGLNVSVRIGHGEHVCLPADVFELVDEPSPTA